MSQLGLGMAALDEGPSRPGGRRSVWAVVIAVIVVVVLLVGLIKVASGLLGGDGPDDYPGPGTGQVTVEIAKGASLTQIGETLAAADVVKSADAFVTAAKANDNAVQIQPGTYTLATQISGAEAVVALLDPANRVDREGHRSPRAPPCRATVALAGPQDPPDAGGPRGRAGPPRDARAAGLREGQPRGLPLPGDVRRSSPRRRPRTSCRRWSPGSSRPPTA